MEKEVRHNTCHSCSKECSQDHSQEEKVLGETPTYSSVIVEALKKRSRVRRKVSPIAFDSTTVMLEKEVKQVLDALSYYYQREEGKDLTSNAHCGEYHFRVSLSRFSSSTSLLCCAKIIQNSKDISFTGDAKTSPPTA